MGSQAQELERIIDGDGREEARTGVQQAPLFQAFQDRLIGFLPNRMLGAKDLPQRRKPNAHDSLLLPTRVPEALRGECFLGLLARNARTQDRERLFRDGSVNQEVCLVLQMARPFPLHEFRSVNW